MSNVIDAVSAKKLAGLQVDLLQKLRNGQLTVEQQLWWQSRTQMERESLSQLTSEKIELLFEKINAGITPQSVKDAKIITDNWPELCKSLLDLDISMEGISIPVPKTGYVDLLMPKGFFYDKIGKLIRTCSIRVRRLLCEIDPQKDARNPENGSYFVRFKAVAEAKDDTADVDEDLLQARGLSAITLLERVWFEIVTRHNIFKEYTTDFCSMTYCYGSRYSDGKVPVVQNYADDQYLDRRRFFSVNEPFPYGDPNALHSTRVVVPYKKILV